MIRVLIVDDSAVVRDLLKHILSSDAEIVVIGEAKDGLEAVELVAKHKPDVVTMDINMPRLNGFEATRQIMEKNPVPIVIVTASWDPNDVGKMWLAMEAGAVATLEKPRYSTKEDYENSGNIVDTVKLMSQVKVIRRWAPKRVSNTPSDLLTKIQPEHFSRQYGIVAIGASTGGPPVIKELLAALPSDFSAPIVIVQHIARNFTTGFAEWLDQSTPLNVRVAKHADRLEPGAVYVAPDGLHMKVDFSSHVVLTNDPPENGLRPSVSYLFRSVAAVFGNRAVGILLTGMGRDGANELKILKDKGAITIAQDKETSVVHGMPGEAIKIGGASHIAPSHKIAGLLLRLVGGGEKK
ncbi:MAG: chemotaxis-specific protein-glutamate methyltransferase CheB [Desulfomonilaceae bacterium]|nr:chemotaxis-specific protein-glutamate methyltransferase CheB [Syntrophaceae bacterium]